MPTPTATIFIPYHALDDVILRGTRAAQPPASAVVAGTLYGVTDEGNLVERSTGTVWQAYSPTGAGALTPHHLTHEPGGTDPMAVDAVAATGSLRTLGSGANQAAPGNDARFAAGTAAHHATHEPGGSDPLAVDAVAATGSLRTLGTGPQQAAPGNDARFAAGTAAHHASHEPGGADALVNAAWTTVANTFTQNQTLTAGFVMFDAAAPADARTFILGNSAQVFQIFTTNDLQTIVQGVPLTLTRFGDLQASRDFYEKGRATAVGHATAMPYSAANFTAAAGAWTVGPANVIAYSWSLVGKTLMLWFTLYGTNVTAAPVWLGLAIPGGAVAGGEVRNLVQVIDAGVQRTGQAVTATGSGVVAIYTTPAQAPWTATAASNTYVIGQIVIPIQ